MLHYSIEQILDINIHNNGEVVEEFASTHYAVKFLHHKTVNPSKFLNIAGELVEEPIFTGVNDLFASDIIPRDEQERLALIFKQVGTNILDTKTQGINELFLETKVNMERVSTIVTHARIMEWVNNNILPPTSLPKV